MSIIRKLNITSDDSFSIDSFGRWRVSNPETIFDSKNVYDNGVTSADNQPLFYDNQEISGSGTSTEWISSASCQLLSVSASTMGIRTRQTKRRFNYQPGKALRNGEPVLTLNGWKPIEEIEVGDIVFDGKGNQTKVIGVYPQEGLRKIYRFTFDDGTFVDADEDHLWITIGRQNSQKGKEIVLTTKEMLNAYGEEPPEFARWRIPKSPVLQFDNKEIKIDPYTLGVILGDGHIDKSGLSESIRYYNLQGKTSIDKYIPDDYKFNCSEIRLEVLKGLMDTDGHIFNGQTEFYTISEQLKDDIEFLVRSLGGQVKCRIKKTSYKDNIGNVIKCKDYYKMTIIMPICPFKLTRKCEKWIKRERISFDRYVHSIKPIGEDLATCIRVESDAHTFLTRGHIVTHNSQEIIISFNANGTQSGIVKRTGLFDDNDGIFLELSGTTPYFVQRFNGVDTKVEQSNWNNDTMDGNGNSQITLDWTKTNLFFIDYEWLGVGRVRVGFVYDGKIYYAHYFNNTQNTIEVYMKTPNLPIRSSIINLGSGIASQFTTICSTVISEGGNDDLGIIRYASTNGTHIDMASENTIYAILGIRLKNTYLAETIKIINTGLQIQTASHQIEWMIILNPTVSGTFNYVDEQYSGVQIARASGAGPTVIGGYKIDGGFLESGGNANGGAGSTTKGIDTALRLGSLINGTRDTIVLCARPIGGSTDVDIEGSISWRELT